MSRFKRFELIEEEQPICYYSPLSSPLFFTTETLTLPSFIEDSLFPFDAITDLVRVDPTPPSICYRRVQRVEKKQLGTEMRLQSLSDRVAELESRFDRLLSAGKITGDRKYTWTAEIKGPEKNGFDRKYKWVAEIADKEEEEEKEKKRNIKLKGGAVAKNIKWTAEIKGKGEESGNTRKYTFEVGSGDAEKKKKKEKEKEKEKVKDKKEKKKGSGLRIVEIEEPSDHRVVVLRQVG